MDFSIEYATSEQIIMTRTDSGITGPENLVRHIEAVQAAVTKRNAEIERLSAEVKRLKEGEPIQENLRQAYRKGYQKAIQDVQETLKPAWSAYYNLGHLYHKAPEDAEESD